MRFKDRDHIPHKEKINISFLYSQTVAHFWSVTYSIFDSILMYNITKVETNSSYAQNFVDEKRGNIFYL